MCTLIVANDHPRPGTVVLGANRDEALDRPSDPPLLLDATEQVVGGRDRLAGGTWLAVRLRNPLRLVAVLNRRDHTGSYGQIGNRALHSRGQLCLDAARAREPEEIVAEVTRRIADPGMNPFSLVVIERAFRQVAYHENGSVRWEPIPSGLHALTHGDLDDTRSTRVASLVEDLAHPSFAGNHDADHVSDELGTLLQRHDGERAVCLHGERYGTVSSSRLVLDFETDRIVSWLFTDSAPCQEAYRSVDASLLSAPVSSPPNEA